MKLFQVKGNEFPTPNTIEILAEVADWRAGRNIGWSLATLESLMATVLGQTRDSKEAQRVALVRLAASAIARIELMDQEKI